jgi:hypothetical protein
LAEQNYATENMVLGCVRMQLHNSWIFVLKSEKVKSQSEQKTKTKFSFLVKTKAQDFWHIAAVISLADTQFLYIYIHTHKLTCITY